MIPLYKKVHVNNEILPVQVDGKRLQTRRSLKTNLNFQRHALWTLRIQLTRLLINLLSRAAAVEMVVDMEEVHLSSQILIVTSLAIRAINRVTTGQK